VVRFVPTWTTRPPRCGEGPGHRFVDDATFERHLAAGAWTLTGTLPGLPHRYGLPRLPPPAPGVVDTVILRAEYVEPFLAASQRPLIVYALADGQRDQAVARMSARGDRPEEVAARGAGYHAEMEAAARVAHRRFLNSSSVAALADQVQESLRIDFRPGPPRWQKPTRTVWHWVGVAAGVTLAASGLLLVAMMVWLVAAMKATGNK